MYQQQSLDQATFNILIDVIRKMGPTSRIYGYAEQVLGQNGYQNARMTTLVQTTMDLFAARSAVNRAANAEQLIFSIAQQVVSVMAANLVKNEPNLYNQLLGIEKAQIDTDAAYAHVLDTEVAAFKEAMTSSAFIQQNQSGPRTSDRFKNRVYATQQTVSVEQPQVDPTPSVAAPNVPGHVSARFSTRTPTKPKQQEVPIMPATEFKNAIAFNPNKQAVATDGTIVDKDDPMYQNHQNLIKSQIVTLSTSKPHPGALEVLGAGIAFNPLELKSTKELANAEPEVIQMQSEQLAIAMQNIIHQDEPFLALGASHASLQFMMFAQDVGVELSEQVFSYDYRDLEIIKILDPDAAKAGNDIFTKTDLSGITSFTSLREWLGILTNSEHRLDRDIANLVNQLTTNVLNEYLFFHLRSRLAIDDFFMDIVELLQITQQKYPDVAANLVAAEPELTERVIEQLLRGLSSEDATLLNRWAGIKAPTLRGRVVGLTRWRAAMHVPANAIELGLEILPASAHSLTARWAFITKSDYPLFYKAANDFMKRLKGVLFWYESISIYTQDGYEYRIHEVEGEDVIAVSLQPRC